MKTLFQTTWAFCMLTAMALIIGCGPNNQNDHADDHHEHTDGEHDEEHEGPHGGHVIELGRDHQFHAELVENEDSKSVTVYMLGEDMKALPISASTMSMNLMVDGEAKTFELTAVEPVDGKASQFNGVDESLFEALHEHEASGKLNVTIDDTPYSGAVEHHDHHDDHADGHADH